MMEARIYSSAQEESAIVERVARIVSSVRVTKPDYTRLAAELEDAVPFDVFGVVLLRHDREAVRVTVCMRREKNWIANYRQHPLKGSMMERILQKPSIVIDNLAVGTDGLPSQRGDALSGHPQLCSILIAP